MKQALDTRTKLLTKSPWPLMIELSIPAVLGMVVVGLYNMMDSIFVGQMVGDVQMGAISVSYPLTLINAGSAAMLGVGSASVLSRAIGKKDENTIKKIMGNLVAMVLLLSVIYTVVGMVFTRQLLSLTGASDNILNYAEKYLRIVFAGSLFVNFFQSANMVIRGEGQLKRAMTIIASGAILNIILDPIFISILNKNPITNATGLSAIIPKDNDGYCTVYKMDCEDGLGLMTVYQVYPGIQLIYNDFEATSCYWDGTIDKNVLEINHCREGREGSVLQSGSCLYLGEGDLSIHTMDNCASEMAFPLRHYRGISVVLDLELVSQNPPGILAESGIGIADFKNKFCADGSCFVMRAKDEIEHIFSELYSVPDRLQKPYFMLKVQELLLFLCMVDVNKEKQRELYTSPQVEIVRDIHKRLISNLQERPTIEELSKEYLINTATLKDTFKGVYGQPIGTYMKVYRMKQAAALLRQTQATIAEIASQVGYENQSKFATAFRDVMKIAPAEYRKQNSGD